MSNFTSRLKQSSFWRITILLPALLLTCSCKTLGPDFEEPEVHWLNSWQPTVWPISSTTSPAQESLQSWWTCFDDPVLDSLIEEALRENHTLQSGGLRVLESRAIQELAGSSLYPQIQQITTSVDGVSSKQEGSSSSDQVFSQFQGVLGWELDFWGRFERAVESADANYFASVAQQRDLQVLIAVQMAQVYFSYRVTEARIAITLNNAEIQKRSFDITNERFAEGEESELDFQQARTQYLATLSVVPQLELILRNTRNAICILLGRPPDEVPEISGDGYRLASVKPVIPMMVPSKHLAHRPDVRNAAWNVAAQSAQIGIAEADYYPALSLLGSLSWSKSSLAGIPDSSGITVGPSLRWNIFDHGAIASNIKIQNARLQLLLENFQRTVMEAAKEVDNSAVEVVKTSEQQEYIDQSVEAARRALEIADIRFREGLIDFQRVLSAQRALFTQVERQVLNRGNHLKSVASLYGSMGGGWRPMDLNEMISADTWETLNERTDWTDVFNSKPAGGSKDQGEALTDE